MSEIYLSSNEIKDITGRTQGAAQRRALNAMGYIVKDRPDGSFWVPRAQFLVEKETVKTMPKKHKLNFGALKASGNEQAALQRELALP